MNIKASTHLQRRTRHYADFLSHVKPLLEHDLVKSLDTYLQHGKYTRLRHSFDVAYFSFVIAKKLGWNAAAVARGALLHDLYHACKENEGPFRFLRSHPHIAAENAKRVCDLTALEEDIIRKHMWLVTLRPPSYKEGYIVTMVDKLCAVRELFICLCWRHKVHSFFPSSA